MHTCTNRLNCSFEMLALPCLESISQSIRLRSAVLRAFASGTEPLCGCGAFVDPFTATQVSRQSACGILLEAVCMPVFFVLRNICPLKFSALLTRALREQLMGHFEDRRLARTLAVSMTGSSDDLRVEIMSYTVCTVRFSNAWDNALHTQWVHIPVAPLNDEVMSPVVCIRTLRPIQWLQLFQSTTQQPMPHVTQLLCVAMQELLHGSDDEEWSDARDAEAVADNHHEAAAAASTTMPAPAPLTKAFSAAASAAPVPAAKSFTAPLTDMLATPSVQRLCVDAHVANIAIASIRRTPMPVRAHRIATTTCIDIAPNAHERARCIRIQTHVAVTALLTDSETGTAARRRIAAMAALTCARTAQHDLHPSAEEAAGAAAASRGPVPAQTLSIARGVSMLRIVQQKSVFADLSAYRQHVCKAAARASKRMLGPERIAAFAQSFKTTRVGLNTIASWTVNLIHYHKNLPTQVNVDLGRKGDNVFMPAVNPFSRTLLTMMLLTQAADDGWETSSMAPADTQHAKTCLEAGDDFARLMLDMGMMHAVSKCDGLQDTLSTILRHALNDAGKRACTEEAADALHEQIALYITHCLHGLLIQVVNKILARVHADVFASIDSTILIDLQKDISRVLNVIPEVIGVTEECERFMQWARQATNGPTTTEFITKDTVKIPMITHKK